MKRMLRILLLAVLMVPIGAKVNAQCSGTMCSVTIQMMDEYGDGWYDYYDEPFYVKVYQGTTLRGQATLGSGASGTQTIAVCSDDSVRFVFDGEDSYTESSFTILNGDGTTILASASCSNYISGQTITTAEVVCPSCIAPFNLSVDASDAENVVVSWIGSASGYEVVVLPATATFDSSVAVSVTDTVVALDTLTSGTAYSVWVRTDCGSEYSTWAGPVSFVPGLYTMTANSSDTLHACGVVIVDDGGLGGDYAPNQNTTLYLYPSDATQMLVLSGSSHSESTYDYVTIYSGIGTSGEVLFTDNGIDVLTTIDTIYSESPVTIVFISDYSNQYDGFQINVSCIDAPDCRRVENFACVDSITTAHTATFTWQSDAGNFQIEYKKAEDTTWTEETSNDTVYELNGLDATTTYNVRVKALCGSDESLYSAVLNVTTTVACPAPTGLSAALTPGDGTVATLTWSDPTGSAWQICLNGDTNNYIDVTETSFEFDTLTPETTYTAKVRRDCTDAEEGYSEWSNTITFTPTDAYSITVNDGTTTNEYVPVYGWMADNGIKSQFVIPAADLSAIQWGSVTKLTFYASDASASLGSDVFKVYLTETNATGVSSLSPVSGMEEVYSGSLGVSGNKMEVTFTTPYQYMGGNLLVAFEEPTAGDYARIYWYGVNATGASMGGYENSYGSYIEQRNFLPKMTIDYTPGEEPTCFPVSGLAVSDITGHTAILTWTGEADGYNVYSISGADTTLVENVSDTTVTLTGLSGETQYTFGVRAACGSDESTIRIVNFTTLISCPAPTALSATLTPGNGTVATLSWHEAGEAAAWQICLDNDMENLIDVTDTTYDMTGLTAEQAITAKVRAICGEGDTSIWCAAITFTPTNAYNITVNDGTTTNSYVPVYGLYTDDHIKSQFIIPAADLSAMSFGIVNKLTFYSSDATKTWSGAVFEVYLTETDATSVNSLNSVAEMEQVYTGSLGIVNNVMEITLTAPYQYMGGNLLVAFEQPTSGDYQGCNWYGVNATGASQGGYGTSVYQRDFLPKMTIDYFPGEEPTCLPVSGLTASGISGDEATLSWVGNASSYNVYAVSATGTTLVQNVTDTTITLTGLSPVSTYTYGVAAVCGSDESMMRNVTFNTACGTITSFPFVEGFSAMPECWTLVDADGDGYNWSILSGYSAIQSASYQSVALTPDNWLITPQLAIPATGSYEVTWTATAQDQNWPAEHYGLFVSTTDNNTSSFTMLQEWTLSTGVFNPVVDLSAYAGQDIYLALRHFNCTDMFRISIDDFTVRAQAGANEVVITLQQNNPAYGAVQGAGTYTIGDTVTVSATPAAGYVFSRWVDVDNVTVSTDNPYTFVAATDLTLKAIFLGANAETYTVTVEVNDTTMGTATGSGTYAAGDMATLTATAYSGYRFVNWTHTSDFGVTVFSTDSIVTITVTGDRVYTANFEADSATQPTQYTVTLSSADATMGTVSPAGATTVDEGASFTATATPANNHVFTGWVDATGDTVSHDNPYTFTVNADITLVGTFRYDGVGIDEAEVSNVSLFPNPATSTFTVSATGMKEATVIDLNGRTVMTQRTADGTATFDVSTLAKGTYFVRIVGEQATAVRKLVVK